MFIHLYLKEMQLGADVLDAESFYASVFIFFSTMTLWDLSFCLRDSEDDFLVPVILTTALKVLFLAAFFYASCFGASHFSPIILAPGGLCASSLLALF